MNETNNPQKNRLLNNKYFLYATEFFSGMSVMAIELGASRLTAPYFSSSQIVWTVIIGVIMIAMALGNLWGGRSADKSKTPDKLYGRLIIAAIWIGVVPFIGKWVMAGLTVVMALVISSNYLVWAALLSCLVLFAFPCVLLGTVTPSLTRFAVDNLSDTGKTVGRLGALNTIGSIIGTFIPTFVTIPTVGTAATFLIFAGILLVLSILYFIAGGKASIKGIVGGVLIIALCFLLPGYTFAFSEDEIVLEDESIYNYLQVKDSERRTVLSTNILFGVQSIRIKSDGLTGMYYDYALAAPVMAGLTGADNESRSVMILGMGSGTYATYCSKYFPGCEIKGAEIDQKIVDIAYDYFEVPKDVEIETEDGRIYLTSTDDKYDVVMVDAYQDITIPFQLSTVEFFTEVSKHLKDGGVMVVNLNMASDDEGSINEYLCDTMAAVFNHVYTIDVPSNTNREVFCTDSDEAIELLFAVTSGMTNTTSGVLTTETTSEEETATKSSSDTDEIEIQYQVSDNAVTIDNLEYVEILTKVSAQLKEYTGGDLILTDDKAPVELLGMKALDSIIDGEITYYKERLLAGESIFDLLG